MAFRQLGSCCLALNLVPFAGIAFLWFMGVVRDRLGSNEDRFFATVFLGSGLLFLAMLFTSAAIAGGLIGIYRLYPGYALQFRHVHFRPHGDLRDHERLYAEDGRGVHDLHLHPLAADRYFPALDGLPGLGAGAVSPAEPWCYFSWASLVFPLWVLLISVYILMANLRKPKNEPTTATAS